MTCDFRDRDGKLVAVAISHLVYMLDADADKREVVCSVEKIAHISDSFRGGCLYVRCVTVYIGHSFWAKCRFILRKKGRQDLEK